MGRKKTHTMFLIILWLVDLIILWLLEEVSTWDIPVKKSAPLGNKPAWVEQWVVFQSKSKSWFGFVFFFLTALFWKGLIGRKRKKISNLYVSIKLLVPVKPVVFLTCNFIIWAILSALKEVAQCRISYTERIKTQQKLAEGCLFITVATSMWHMDRLWLQRVGYVCGRITVSNGFLNHVQKCSKIQKCTVFCIVPLATPVEH